MVITKDSLSIPDQVFEAGLKLPLGMLLFLSSIEFSFGVYLALFVSILCVLILDAWYMTFLKY